LICLAFWCDLDENTQLYPFIKASNTIKNNCEDLVNYIQSKISNGILEDINSKIELAKK
jgi:transposase